MFRVAEMTKKDEEGYFFMVHPSYEAAVLGLTPREMERERSHRRRWEKRYGKPYPIAVLVVGEAERHETV